jgi:hypothetical protein
MTGFLCVRTLLAGSFGNAPRILLPFVGPLSAADFLFTVKV